MVDLATNGYSDSELLNNTLQSITDNLNWYYTKMNELENLSTVEEMIDFLENLD